MKINFIKQRFACRAFTLIETAIILGIVSLVISGGLSIYKVLFLKQRQDITRQRLDEVRDALAKFNQQNNRLPCVAPFNVAPGASGFGIETTDKCQTDALQTGTGDLHNGTFRPLNLSSSNNPVRIGAVPVISLGLSIDHAMDGWGRRFVYAVTENLADTTLTNTGHRYDPVNGGIKLLGPDGVSILGPKPQFTPFIVMSLGKSGVGGYNYEGTPTSQNCASAGTKEKENCDFDNNVIFRTAPYSESPDTSQHFDDIIVNDLGALTGSATDAVVVCGNQGMIYGPGKTGADANGCVSVASAPAANPVAPTCDASKQGTQWYNTTLSIMEVCDGTNWIANNQLPNCTSVACKPAVAGSLCFNTTGKQVNYCDGTLWMAMGGSGGTVYSGSNPTCPPGKSAVSKNWAASTKPDVPHTCNIGCYWSSGCTQGGGWSGQPTGCTYTQWVTWGCGNGCTRTDTTYPTFSATSWTQVQCM